MGMFDKDKLMAPDGRLSEFVEDEQEFILRDLNYIGDIDTPDGPTDTAPMVHLSVSALDSPTVIKTVSMVGDIAKSRADDKDLSELPAVCRTLHVPSKITGGNDAFVFQWVRDYKDNEPPKAAAPPKDKAKDKAKVGAGDAPPF